MDMHVLTGNAGSYSIAMHFEVPDANNAAGKNYREALLNSGLGGNTRLAEGIGPGQITSAEKTQIEAGELYEHVEPVSVDGVGQSTGGRRAVLRAKYTAVKAAVIADLQAKLKFFGYTESEAE